MNAFTPAPNPETAPADAGGEVETACTLVERLEAAGRQSTAEMLQELRRAFPHSPLAVRVRALDVLRRR